jgi:hypothetical protein
MTIELFLFIIIVLLSLYGLYLNYYNNTILLIISNLLFIIYGTIMSIIK